MSFVVLVCITSAVILRSRVRLSYCQLMTARHMPSYHIRIVSYHIMLKYFAFQSIISFIIQDMFTGGGLKTRDWKIRDGQKMQGRKRRDWKTRRQTAGLENAGKGI